MGIFDKWKAKKDDKKTTNGHDGHGHAHDGHDHGHDGHDHKGHSHGKPKGK